MIEYALLVALGFLVAGILALLFAGPFWRRAVRLTTKRLEATMPMSIADIHADKDQMRAEYAVEIRRLEIAHDREKEHAARYLVERNKHKVEIGEMKTQLKALTAQLAERGNASTVLEQTIRKKIPELREQLERARQIIATRDRELARVQTAYDNQTEALGTAKKANGRFSTEIERLREALESGAARDSGSEADGDAAALDMANKRLQADISRLRQEVGQLREEDAAAAAALKDEMHELAGQMLRGTPVKARSPAAGKRKSAGSKADDQEDDAIETVAPKAEQRKRTSGRHAKKTSGRSLADRLKQLAVKTDA